MTGLAARLVTEGQELAGLSAPWWQLWRRLPNATVFQSPAWLLPWWRAFHPGRLFTVTVHEGDRLVGLAPFYIDSAGPAGRLLPLGISLSDATDILADPGCEAAVAACMSRTLGEHRSEWTGMCLPEVPPGAGATLLTPACAKPRRSEGSVCPVLALDGPGGLANVPAGKRRKLRMARHRLGRAASGRIADAPAFAPEEWFRHLQRLHGVRWRARGQTGVLDDTAAASFHREALAQLCEHGLARLYALLVDGAVVGAYYGFLHGAEAQAYIGGFDPAAAYYSPGALLLGHAIGAASEEGASTFDFLRGSEPYKYEWGARDRPNAFLSWD